jgi:fumarylpyruvate hydrolase
MKLAIEKPPLHTLPVSGADLSFPVNRVYCVGRNYAAHAREMGKDPDRDPPFFFMKPADAIVDASRPTSVRYPSMTRDYQHEIELVVAIGKRGFNISGAEALHHVYGYAVGLDMTRRDLQLEAREKGRPWEFGKSFAQSAPIGAIHRASESGHLKSAAISLFVNDELRQSSDIAKLIWSVSECIAYVSQYDPLEAGDILMTGTPEGVGAVIAGDRLKGDIAGLSGIELVIDPSSGAV